MNKLLERRLARLLQTGDSAYLKGGKKGLEKESLRITDDGAVSSTPHPSSWGSPLTHPYITTDYSEALPELITPPFSDIAETVKFLDDTHHFLYAHMPLDELLWAASMPCAVSDDSAIPIAEYGSSNAGQIKHIYRTGLDWRYGRKMQAIAGVHFNYSLPKSFWSYYHEAENSTDTMQEFINFNYFSLIRNFKRLGWIVPFLFGTSPAVCKSFLAGRTTRFKQLMHGTYYLPHATSLRMSDIGYKNKNQSALVVSYDNLDGYIHSLQAALATPYPEYEAIGLYNDDKRIQLSTNVLQIENEYYSFIRPKQTSTHGERSSQSLASRGVEYVEVRALDLNCHSKNGVDATQLRFLEAFLIFCLLEESPLLSKKELSDIEYNELTVALRGHEPNLELIDSSQRRKIKTWSLEICDRMLAICECLDSETKNSHYVQALKTQVDAISHPDTLPAAKILQTLIDNQEPFQTYAMNLSKDYAKHYRDTPTPKDFADKFSTLAQQSHEEQTALENANEISLDNYIRNYIKN